MTSAKLALPMPIPKHSTDEKVAWLSDWIKRPENQGSTTAQIQQALQAQFGETIGSRRLSLTLQAARGVLLRQFAHFAPGTIPQAVSPPPPLPTLADISEQIHTKPTTDTLIAIRAAMQSCGIVGIVLSPTGQMEVTLRPRF
jgi:hypothetical protein